MSAILARGVGLAAVTVPAGVVAATVPPRQDLAVRPEWVERERRQRARAEARTRRRVERRADHEGADPASPALAVSLGGDLDRWRIGDLVVPPPNQLDLSMLLLGQPGVGKSTAAERITFLAAQEGRQLVAIDGKGDEDFAAGVIAAYLTARPGARIGLFPATPYDLWRGSPAELVGRLMGAWSFTAEAEFYANIAQLGLRLAASAPGVPPIQSAAGLVERLDPSWLNRSWQGHPAELSIIRDLKSRLADVAVRMGNLAAALAGGFDGCWAVEDVDLAVFSVPTLSNPSDGDACMRMLLGDVAHYATRRKPRQRRALVLFDEFSSLEGGRRTAVNLVERARGPHVGVVLAGQSAVSLGDEDDRARLLASVNAVLAFRTPDPAALTALAGTTREAEAAFALEDGELTSRQTITVRSKARVDADQLRAARTGEATLISGGRAEAVRVIRTAIPAATAGEARLLVTGLTRPRPAVAASGDPDPKRGPAGAVDEREVPPPGQPRQGPSAPSGSPSASLDGPVRSMARRRRPPQVGPGSPPDDRMPEEEVVPEP